MANMRLLSIITLISVVALACRPQVQPEVVTEVKLDDLAKVTASEREEALANWERVETAFKANDQGSLKGLIGCKVLVQVDASGSPRTGKAMSMEERVTSAEDAQRLAGAKGEQAGQIASQIRQRLDSGWHVACRIEFTERQIREHFIWPDAVFTSQFDVLGTLTAASLADRSIRVKPMAIPLAIPQL